MRLTTFTRHSANSIHWVDALANQVRYRVEPSGLVARLIKQKAISDELTKLGLRVRIKEIGRSSCIIESSIPLDIESEYQLQLQLFSIGLLRNIVLAPLPQGAGLHCYLANTDSIIDEALLSQIY
ncbi:hypothetical protein A3K86_18335 [Photobacterium jeanii]|uniref:Uncharacterized protein n=1 Tax=Photobacterium jeanii TaxID=858640 RepID=A0A178K2J9_9GAMM|nr:hypothetical protein [Photobacterium jeanii]OAN10942.1 hypothetical protein A3K86_18335 [Photobacterium jeanii]PST90458.1 hypothetical protein C9I91_07435 [Photobacterium jeanii]